MINSRVSWMLRPVERSITVSAPQRIDQTILSTSAATSDATALLPLLALILTRKLRPIAIGSASGWLPLPGMIARPRAISLCTNSGVTQAGLDAPKSWPARIMRPIIRRAARRVGEEGVITLRYRECRFHFKNKQ